jgi:hypothetical protein
MQILTIRQWDLLGYEGRHAHLTAATPAQALAQAQVVAQASRRSVREIFNAWVALGYLSIAAAAEALATPMEATR